MKETCGRGGKEEDRGEVDERKEWLTGHGGEGRGLVGGKEGI